MACCGGSAGDCLACRVGVGGVVGGRGEEKGGGERVRRGGRGGGVEEGFNLVQQGGFAGVVETQQQDGVFGFGGVLEVEGADEVVHLDVCSGLGSRSQTDRVARVGVSRRAISVETMLRCAEGWY